MLCHQHLLNAGVDVNPDDSQIKMNENAPFKYSEKNYTGVRRPFVKNATSLSRVSVSDLLRVST